MAKSIEKKIGKYSETCCCCGVYKMKAIFFNWYRHPALHVGNELIGIISLRCAQRECGKKYIKFLLEEENEKN